MNTRNRSLVAHLCIAFTSVSLGFGSAGCFSTAPDVAAGNETSGGTETEDGEGGPGSTSADPSTSGGTADGDSTPDETAGDTTADDGATETSTDSGSTATGAEESTGGRPVICEVDDVEPFAAFPGEVLTIHGTGFGPSPTVLFSGVEADISTSDDQTIEVTVPEGGGSTIQVSNEFGPCNEYIHQVWDIHTWDTWEPPGPEHGTTRTQGLAVDESDVPRIIVNDGGGSTSYLASTYDPQNDDWPDLTPVLTGNNHANYNTSFMTMVASPSDSQLHMAWRSGGGRVNHLSVEAPAQWDQSQTTPVFIPPQQGIGVHLAVHPSTGTVLIGHIAGNFTDGFTPYFVTSSMAAFSDTALPGTTIGSSLDSGNVRVAYPPGALPMFLTVDRNDPYTLRLHTLHNSGTFTVAYFAGGVDDTGLTMAHYLRPIELVSDSANRPVIAYMSAEGEISVARYTGGLPFDETVIATDAVSVLDFKLDADNNFYLVYGTNDGRLRLSRYISADEEWHHRTLAQLDAGGAFSRGISMGLDSRARLHVIYLQRVQVEQTPYLTARVLYTRP